MAGKKKTATKVAKPAAKKAAKSVPKKPEKAPTKPDAKSVPKKPEKAPTKPDAKSIPKKPEKAPAKPGNFRGHQMLSAKELTEMLGSDTIKVSVTRRSVKDALTAKADADAAATLKKYS